MLVAVGFVEETDDHRYCNSVALLRDGELVGLHRKVYLPTYGLFDEGRFTRPGDRIRTYDVGAPIGRIGLSVCEDFWHAIAADAPGARRRVAARERRRRTVARAGLERRAAGDRGLAQDAGHLRAARHGARSPSATASATRRG